LSNHDATFLLFGNLVTHKKSGTKSNPCEQSLGSMLKTLPSALAKLSPREKQIFTMIGREMSSSEIGEALGITTQTVLVHRKRIGKKTGAGARKATLLALLAHYVKD
jgi:DNA-binding CsgD family transcriptional regulator